MKQEREGMTPSRIGWMVFWALAVLTAVEYIAAVTIERNVPVLVVLAVVKAGLIVWYFMHLIALWRAHGEEG